VVVANREYEIYKYINRFAEAAENAGAKTPDWITRRISPASPQDGTPGDERSGLIWLRGPMKGFSQEALGDLKKISSDQPGAWAPFNPPRQAAGALAP
jgi:hypothetical protein